MYRSRLTKSMVKHQQDTPEVAQFAALLPLALLRNGHIDLHPQGLRTIEDQLTGKLYLVGNEGPVGLLNALYRTTNFAPQESGLWLTSYPRHDAERNEQFLFVDVVADNQEERARLHVLAALICSGIVIAVDEESSYGYLGSIEGRVVYDGHQKDQALNQQQRRKAMSGLIFVETTGSASPGEVRRPPGETSPLLQRLGVGEICESGYSSVTHLGVSEGGLMGGGPQYVSAVEEQVRRGVQMYPSLHEDLHCGPILREYIEKVVHSLNRSGMVDVAQCVGGIEISEDYDAYSRAVETYHRAVASGVGEDSAPNLQEVLQLARQEAVEEFKTTSSDAHYLSRLIDYTTEKEQQLRAENEKGLQLKNMAYLKRESESILAQINGGQVSEEEGDRLIGRLVEDYKVRGEGESKYELLSGYLQVLNSAVHKGIADQQVRGVQGELQRAQAANRKLEKQVGELERRNRENSEKCCELM